MARNREAASLTGRGSLAANLSQTLSMIADPPERWQRGLAAVIVTAFVISWAVASSMLGVLSCARVFVGMVGVAWYAGMGPALAATTLATVLSVAVPDDRMIFSAGSLQMFVGGTIFAIVVSRLVTTTRRSKSEALENGTALESKLTELASRDRDLADAETRSRAIVETAFDGIITMDGAGIIRSFNQGAERIFGYKAEEAIGQRVTMLVPPRDRAAHTGYLDKYLTTGQRTIIGNETQVVALHKQGTEFLIKLTAREIPGTQGRLFVGVFQDVTRQVKTEQELRLSEKRYRSLVAASKSLVWVTDPSGRFVGPQVDVEKFAGRSWPSYEGAGILEFVHPDDRHLITGRREMGVLNSSTQVFTARIWHAASQSWHHCEFLVVPLKGGSGEILEWIGTTTDVEDRFQVATLERLKVTDERTRLAESVAHLGTWEWRPGISFAGSAGLWRLLGRKASHAPNHDVFLEIVDPRDHGLLVEAFEEAAHGKDIDVEFRTLETDGHERWLYVRGRYRKAGSLQAGRIVGICMDKTEKVEVRNALAQALDEAQETAEDLRHANTAKDAFLSMVSHELRTPLTLIKGNADVLRRLMDQGGSGTFMDALEDIAGGAAKLEGLIENLLVLARLERRQELDLEPVLLQRLVQSVVEQYRKEHPDRSFELLIEPESQVIPAYPDYLQEVIRNLVSNADKYSPPGELITIEVAQSESDAEVRVLDRGIGIAPEEEDRIFEPFYRSERTSARVSGLGVGLAVCSRVVAALNGRLWAQARDGGGSEFGFAIPVGPTSAQDDRDSIPALQPVG